MQSEITLTLEEMKLAAEAEQKGKDIIKQFRRSQSVDPERINQVVENVAFYEGKQYQLESYKGGRPHGVKMRTPHASLAIKTRVASLVAEEYNGRLFPIKSEDKEAVDALNKLVQDEFLRDKVATKINKCIGVSAITRSSYLHVIFDDKEPNPFNNRVLGTIKTHVIDRPESVHFDPEALNIQDSQWALVVNRIPREEAYNMYPDFANILKSTGGAFNAEDRSEVYLNNKDYVTEQENVLTRIVYYFKRYEEGNPKPYIVKQTLVEKFVVHEVELKGQSLIPIAQMRWEDEISSPYGKALMDDLLSLQKAINTIESAITAVAVSYSAPSYVVSRASGIDPRRFAQLVSMPGAVFLSNAPVDTSVRALNLPDLNASVVSTKQEFINEIDRIAGITNPYLGSIGTAGNTAQGTRMSIERSRIIENNVLANVKVFVEQIIDIMIDYMKTQYSGEDLKTRKVDFQEGKVTWEDVTLGSNIKDIRYDFYIDLASKMPFSIEREKEKIFEIFQVETQYGVNPNDRVIQVVDLIEAIGLDNSDKFRERAEEAKVFNSNTQAEAVINMTNLQQDLQLDPELLRLAIVDLLSGLPQTPNLDTFMQTAKETQFEMKNQQNDGLEIMAQTLADAGQDPSEPLDKLAELNAPIAPEE